VGTNPLLACGDNAWPPDTDNNGVGNGVINNLDFLIVLGHWQKADPEPGYNQRADIFDGNGTINNLDFLPVLGNWQQSCT